MISNGTEHPIAFASRTLNKVKNITLRQREVLSQVFGIKKFHKYFYGQRFVMVTDH